MNREQAKALLPIITAFAEGKEIQFLNRERVWGKETHEDFSFQYEPEWYRIKPEPLKFWINVYRRWDGSGMYTVSFSTEVQADEDAYRAVNYVGTYPMEIEL